MKKLIMSTLILILVLGLCACGSNTTEPAPTGQPSANLPIETEPTTTEPIASAPTEEELAMLEAYADVYGLLDTIDGDFAEYYETLAALDAQVLARWGNTEYAPSESFGDPINWDLNEVMANFTVVEDVLLEQSSFRIDKVGNRSDDYYKVYWKYDKNGVVSSILNEHMAETLIEEFPENIGGELAIERDETGNISKVVYGSGGVISDIVTYNYDQYGRLNSTDRTDNYGTEECATFAYDDAGNLIRIECDARVYTYTYNENGQLSSSETSYYINGNIYSCSVMEFNYDENGILTNAVERIDQYDYSFFTGLNQIESYSTYDHHYTCDELGRITKAEIHYGPTYYADGTIKSETTVAVNTYEFTYGNYYIYNAD